MFSSKARTNHARVMDVILTLQDGAYVVNTSNIYEALPDLSHEVICENLRRLSGRGVIRWMRNGWRSVDLT